MGEHPPRQVPDDLAIGQCAIDAGTHRPEITLTHVGNDRRASKLTIGQRDPRCRGGLQHLAQELSADLMAEPALAAVDGHHHLVELEPERGGDAPIEDLCNGLNLEIVIA